MFIDILQSPSLLSLSLQDNNLDMAWHSQIPQIFEEVDPFQWPTVRVFLPAVKLLQTLMKMDQGVCLKNYSECAKKVGKDQAAADLNHLDEKLRIRLEWSDTALLREILLFLDTQNWIFRHSSGSEVSSDNDESLDEITDVEAKNVEIYFILDEMEDAVLYSRKYFNIKSDIYKRVWHRLHTAPDATQLPNLLQICQLLFSLPFFTAKVERTFSALKVIKTERRVSLNSSALEDLLEVKLEGPPLNEFSADAAVELWWKPGRTVQDVFIRDLGRNTRRENLKYKSPNC